MAAGSFCLASADFARASLCSAFLALKLALLLDAASLRLSPFSFLIFSSFALIFSSFAFSLLSAAWRPVSAFFALAVRARIFSSRILTAAAPAFVSLTAASPPCPHRVLPAFLLPPPPPFAPRADPVILKGLDPSRILSGRPPLAVKANGPARSPPCRRRAEPCARVGAPCADRPRSTRVHGCAWPPPPRPALGQSRACGAPIVPCRARSWSKAEILQIVASGSTEAAERRAILPSKHRPGLIRP